MWLPSPGLGRRGRVRCVLSSTVESLGHRVTRRFTCRGSPQAGFHGSRLRALPLSGRAGPAPTGPLGHWLLSRGSVSLGARAYLCGLRRHLPGASGCPEHLVLMRRHLLSLGTEASVSASAEWGQGHTRGSDTGWPPGTRWLREAAGWWRGGMWGKLGVSASLQDPNPRRKGCRGQTLAPSGVTPPQLGSSARVGRPGDPERPGPCGCPGQGLGED